MKRSARFPLVVLCRLGKRQRLDRPACTTLVLPFRRVQPAFSHTFGLELCFGLQPYGEEVLIPRCDEYRRLECLPTTVGTPTNPGCPHARYRTSCGRGAQ